MKPNLLEQNNRSRFGCFGSYIDWTPFFRTWQLFGNIRLFLTDDVVGEHFCFLQMQEMLEVILKRKKL
jgi:5-methyltetrahydrofolate--homocysteine methyltransferase